MGCLLEWDDVDVLKDSGNAKRIEDHLQSTGVHQLFAIILYPIYGSLFKKNIIGLVGRSQEVTIIN